MRYELTLLMAMLLTLISCKDRNTLNKLSGNYSGTLIQLRQNLLNGNLSNTSIDSFSISLSITDEVFERTNQLGSCPGEIIVDGELLTFDSDHCDCHCQCSPFIDCAGDIILGEYSHQWTGDLLTLNFEKQIDTVQMIGSDFLGFRHVKSMELIKE